MTEHQRRKLTLSLLISPHVLRLSLHSFMRNTLSQPSIELFLLLSSSLSPSLMAMTEPHSPSVPLQSFTSIYLLFKTVLSSVFVRYLSLPSSSPFGQILGSSHGRLEGGLHKFPVVVSPSSTQHLCFSQSDLFSVSPLAFQLLFSPSLALSFSLSFVSWCCSRLNSDFSAQA